MGELTDYDIFGNELSTGEPVLHYEADAVSQALQLYFTARKGETLYDPEDGGLLEKYAFKNLSRTNLDKISFSITNTLSVEFVPRISISQIDIIPDNDNRILRIVLRYIIDQTQEIVETTIFTDITVDETPNYSYEDIDLVGDNLFTFVQIKKPSVGKGVTLNFNYDENSWVWDTFKFINFNLETDPRGSDILQLANAS